jgi:hypothetical protein
MALSSPQSDPAQPLRDEFRRQLEAFYAKLKLAPPYHSVEKAITQLTGLFRALPEDEQHRLAGDLTGRRALYRQAFAESGLNQKHRGIIAGLAKTGRGSELPEECRHFLELFS